MIIPSFINRITKYLVILILVATFVFGIYWLWQRQPKPPKQETKNTVTGQTESSKEKKQDFAISPEDFSVLTSTKVKFKGKTVPDSYLAIFSNASQNIIKVETDGNFEKEIDLAEGLNLIDLVTISSDMQTKDKKSLTLLVDKDTKNGDTVFAGSVKSIFDTQVTITTANGQKEIRASKTTAVSLQKESGKANETTGSTIASIRIGDYLIAQGNISKDQLQAKKIDILRETKPQNTRRLFLVKTLTAPRQNLFSAKNQQNNEIEEFNLSKTSQVQIDGKNSKITDITKDKNTIIISHEEKGKELVDLIYLLP